MSRKKEKIIPHPPLLPCTGVESHAHLDSKQYTDDLDEVIANAQNAGVEWIGQVFLSPEAYYTNQERFAKYNNFFYIFGIHPTEAFLYSPQTRKQMEAILASEKRIRAIGEIGLDYYWKEVSKDLQKDVFVMQLELARKTDLPVVIHSRDATNDTLEILFSEGFKGYPLLWHCFGEDKNTARAILDAGWHISIPGPVTYPKNSFLREAVAYIPLDRLMVETDCPYLNPEPLRGTRNEPANLGYTIQSMAQAKNMDSAELWSICGNNAKRFFKLDEIS